ncbi:c-type cytochrome [Parapedomonas caeni]
MRVLRMLAPLASVALLTAAGAAYAQSAPDGAALYKRCAACHLASGAGVPGSFPPLDGHVAALAEAPGGRDYLVMVISAGLTGEMKVGASTYRGFMPAQVGLKDDAAAALLNHVLTGIIKPASKAKPFTAEEVAAIRATHKGKRAADVMKMRPALPAKAATK